MSATLTPTQNVSSLRARTALRRASRLIVGLLVGAIAAGGISAEASAWSRVALSGNPGTATVSNIYVGDLNVSGTTHFTLYGDVNVVAYRAPGTTGVQTIGAQYFVQKLNSSNQWVGVAQSPAMSGVMNSNQSSVVFVPPYLQPSVARGYFRIVYVFVWTNANGATIASSAVVPNLVGDHRCVTRVRWCSSGAGWVRTGGYLTNAW